MNFFSCKCFLTLCALQPWESQSFCSTFPYEIVCSDSWGQSLLVATDTAGVMLLDGEIILINISRAFKHPYNIKRNSYAPSKMLMIFRTSGPDPTLTSGG